MYDNTGPGRYVTRRNILIVVVGIAIIIGIFYFITHGFLSIKDGGKGAFTYTSFGDDLTISNSSAKGAFNLLPSGEYSVQLPTESGGIHTVYTKIPYFFQTRTIMKRSDEPLVAVVARGTPVRLALATTDLVGWNEEGLITSLNADTVSNSTNQATNNVFFPNFDQVVQVSPRYIGGVTKVDDFYLPAYYDFDIADSQAYKPIETKEDLFVKEEAGGFSLFDTKNKRFNLYQPGVTEVTSVKESSDPVAKYNMQPLYSVSPSRTAFLAGGNIFNDNENEEAENKKVNLTLHIIDTKTSKEVVKKSLNTALVQDVLVSKNGRYVFVKTNQSMVIYDTETLKKVYAAPYVINKFIWINDDKFAYQTTENGLFIGSVKNRDAVTAVPYSLIQPSELSFISGDWLYFTAYSRSNKGSQTPDAYRVSLRERSTPTSSEVLSEFPHQGEGFYADYIDGRVVVQLTRYIYSTGSFESSEAKAAASVYLSDIFGDSIPEVRYSYIVSDLRKQPETEEE